MCHLRHYTLCYIYASDTRSLHVVTSCCLFVVCVDYVSNEAVVVSSQLVRSVL